MSSVPKKRISPEEYLAIERRAEFRSEFYQGEMFAMAGGSENHITITGNVFASLHAQLRHRKCRVFQSEMRVKVLANGLYTYPDIVLTCDAPRFDDQVRDTLLNPQAIIEVLSPSTEAYDRGKKFELYRGLESFREYLLVAQDRMAIDHYVRNDEGEWMLKGYNHEDEIIRLPTIDCKLALRDVYEKVDFTSEV